MLIIFHKTTGEIYSFATGSNQEMSTMFPDTYTELRLTYDEVQIPDQDCPPTYRLMRYKVDIGTRLLVVK